MTADQRRRMEAGDPVRRMREQYRGKLRPGTPAACFTCRRFLDHDGGCNGVPAPPQTTPPCHENVYTGQVAIDAAAVYVEGQGWRLRAGQDRFYEIETPTGDGQMAIVGPKAKA